jgi:tRNA A-37 threonylcarbamoyl transferase component Bud32
MGMSASAPSWFGSVADAETDPLLGATLGGTYRVVSVLGEGGMGRVYLAEHTRIPGKRYALKMLHPEFARHPEALARFEREAEAAAALSHPNVVGVYDIDHAGDGRPYLVCEFLDGVELGAKLEESGTLSVPMAVRIVRQICRALAAAHERGVIHRDVKPENVFLVGDAHRPVVKVLDFGLSRLARAGDATLTRAGAIMGTPAYMAPEQALGRRVDHRADVYGVGTILYRSVTGLSPFEREDPAAALAAVLTEEPPRPRQIAPELPEELEAIIQRAMAKEPEERFQSMEEMSSALARFEQGSTADAATLPASGVPMPTLPPAPVSQENTGVGMRITPHARPLLLVTACAALVWAATLLTTAAASAIGLAAGRPASALSQLELGLLVSAVSATLVTPGLLVIRHVKKRIWENTVKVGELLRTVVVILLASAAAYGIAAAVVEVTDGVVRPFLSDSSTGPVAWPGWSLVWAAVAVLAGMTAGVRIRSLAGTNRPSAFMRLFAGPVLIGAALLGSAALLYEGFYLRDTGHLRNLLEPITEPEPATTSTPIASATPTATASGTPTVEPTATAEPGTTASAGELAAAMKAGGLALEKLAKKYPTDPTVVRSLVSVYAAKEATALHALEWSKKLLELRPDEANSDMIRKLAMTASQGAEPAASRAFELMGKSMGHFGPDLLYDLYIGAKQEVKTRAKRVLTEPETRALATPALLVAFDLRAADGCPAQAELLDRAAAEGDRRAVQLLSLATEGTRTGCGKKNRQPCPAKCTGDIGQKMRDTAKAIEERLRKGG